MKRLILLFIILSASIQVEAAKMSSYTNNTTPNEDVYFIGVDPNDTTQTANGSNYRYSLSSILGSGLLDFNVNSLTVSGTGDSWIELENNTSFTDTLTGKYGLRFYNGVLQQILNGTATNIGSASIQELASDPAYTDLDTGEMAVSTASGDLFIKTATGLYTIAGTYAPDPTTPTLTSLTIPTSGDTATAVFSEAVSYGAGGAGGWTLNSPTNAMTYASGTGTDTIVFNLASTILSTDTPTVLYTQPTNGFESADDGVDLASITNATVTNNSTQTGGVACTGDFSSGDNESFESAEDAFCTTGWAVSDISGAISTYDTSFYNTGTHGASIICDEDTEANNNRIYADLGVAVNTGLYIRYYIKFDDILNDNKISAFFAIGNDDNEILGGAAYQTLSRLSGVFYTTIRTAGTGTVEKFAITPGNKYRVEIYIVKYGASIMRLYDSSGAAVVTTNGGVDTEVEMTSGNIDIRYLVFRDESSSATATTIKIDDVKISTTGWVGE